MKKVKIEENSPENAPEDTQQNTSENAPEDMAPQSNETTDASQSSTSTAQSSAESAAAQSDATAELLSDLQRTRADFENYRKQVESQKALAMSAAKYATVEKFLPLVDDFERALSAYSEQLAPLRKNFEKTLASLGLSQIDSVPGTEFNPDLHEAVSVEDDEGETEVVAETLRPGYLYDGSVIRAAMVKVKHK